jgi:glycine/D-amino acid oxidase-like deaminating enzyme
MSQSFDAVIVGGGIVGAACALAFSQRGMRLALVEKGEIGAGATAAAMGHIVVLDDSPAQLALTRYSQSLWRRLAPCLPPDAEYTQRGTLWVAEDDEEMQEICRKHSAYSDAGISCRKIDAHSLASLEPALRPGLSGGLLMEEDAVVAPRAGARFLLCETTPPWWKRKQWPWAPAEYCSAAATNCTRPSSSTQPGKGLRG